MVFCSNCGADIDENQKFCPECGTKNEKAFAPSTTSPPPPPAEPETPVDSSMPPPPPPPQNIPPPPPAGSQSDIPPPKEGVLGRLDIDQEDIDEVAEKAKKGLGMLGRFARQSLKKGAELANQGIEAAKDTIEERRGAGQPAQPYQPAPPAPATGSTFCPNCGQGVTGPGKFCNHCGHKLE